MMVDNFATVVESAKGCLVLLLQEFELLFGLFEFEGGVDFWVQAELLSELRLVAGDVRSLWPRFATCLCHKSVCCCLVWLLSRLRTVFELHLGKHTNNKYIKRTICSLIPLYKGCRDKEDPFGVNIKLSTINSVRQVDF